jgi:hypothetical protein
MPQVLYRYATPLITGLFLVSLISGLALFLHIGPGGFHPMHEWLSLVLIVPFVLHIWRNWRPMVSYFKHAPMVIALVISLAAGAAFVFPGASATGSQSGPPQFAFADRLMQASVAEIAPALHVAPQDISDALTDAGFTVPASDAPLSGIAESSGKSPAEALAALTAIPAR